jgi:predicted enzyme related to lactoylglutathione lyase
MKITKHVPGTACWVDLGTSDVEGAKRFYADVFGWQAREVDQADAGGYSIFYLGDDRVAAVAPHMTAGQPTVWTVYFATDDNEATMAAVEAAGGKVMFAPLDIYTEGRMALYFDHEGTVFAAWQPRDMPGSDIVGEPGSLTWVELMTRDADGAKRFYGSVFGWTGETSEIGGAPYTLWQVAGADRAVGGMMEMVGEVWPAELPSHWMPYFEVADCDATAALVKAGGGTVGVEPTTIPPGRFAVCSDPQGAFFSILASTPMS